MTSNTHPAFAQRGETLGSFRWKVEEGQERQFRQAIELTGADFIRADHVPLTYSVTTGLWHRSHQEILEKLGLDPTRVVHGEQTFDLVEPLQIGEEYLVTNALADVAVKAGRRGGEMLVVSVETVIADLEGRVCVREIHTSIQLDGRMTNPPARRGPEPSAVPRNEPSATATVGPLSLRHFVRYAAASGDFNPVHFDVDLARSMGNPGVFAMGMLPGSLLAEFAYTMVSPLRVSSLVLRFTDRVWGGETLLFSGKMHDLADNAVRFETVAASADGVVKVRGVGSAATSQG